MTPPRSNSAGPNSARSPATRWRARGLHWLSSNVNALTIGAHEPRSTLRRRSRMEPGRTKALRDSAWAAHRAAQEVDAFGVRLPGTPSFPTLALTAAPGEGSNGLSSGSLRDGGPVRPGPMALGGRRVCGNDGDETPTGNGKASMTQVGTGDRRGSQDPPSPRWKAHRQPTHRWASQRRRYGG